jgi:hypothetical protein
MKTRNLIPALLRGALWSAGLLVSGTAMAVNTNSQCVGNLQSPLSPGNSCTANDVTLILVGLGDQTDGCMSTSDTVSLFLGAKLQNTGASTRYDIGLFIYDYLGTGDPTPNALSGQQCAVETLKPAYTTAGVGTCGPLNLTGGSGPYYNDDGNGCADLVKGQCGGVDVFMKFTQPITIKCTDAIGAGTSTPDGFVDIPTCTTWGNNKGQVGPSGVCSSENDVMPGTGSKCNCQVINSNIPVARLAPSCTCTPTPVRPGQSSACTVSFTNTIPNCSATVPSGGTTERFECGTASFVRFKVGYNSAQGQMLNSASSPATPAETTGGSVTVDTTNSQVVWVPKNTTLSGSSSGIIGPNESGSMTYQFYVDPSVASGTTINQTVTTYWSNTGPTAWTSEVAQSATVTCSFAVSNQATFARVSSFGAAAEGGRVVLTWDTAAEVGTAAFEVERLDPASGRFVRVTERPVPAVAQLPGGRYVLVDPEARRGETLTYRLTEVDQSGAREVFGPFKVEALDGAAPAGDRGGDFHAQGKEVSPRLIRAVHARERSAASLQPAAQPVTPAPARRARVEVTRSGLQRVRTADVAAGLGISTGEAAAQLGAGRLHLSRAGQDVSWQAAADGDGLVFYGEAIHNAFTDTNVYWLDIGRGQLAQTLAVAAAGGPAASSFTEVLHLETDAIPAVAAAVPVDDYWIWKNFYPGYPGFDRATFPVVVPAPATGASSLAVHLYGFAAEQRAELRLNGHHISDMEWQGTGPATVTVALPVGTLLDGANQIEIVALEADLGFWLDSFDLTYPRLYRADADRLSFRAAAGGAVALTGFHSSDVAVYDVAQPLAPRRLGGLPAQPQADGSWGVSFLAPDAGPFVAATGGALATTNVRGSSPADLRNARGATYLVISPAELRAEAQRLADLRAAQGLSTLVVDLNDVMDLFADGLYDPAAVQRFLAYAIRSWQVPPRYVVLAGKGTYDYRNLLGLSSNLMPPLLVATEAGLAPADSLFADLDGGGVPAVAIGRIPALNAAEMHAYVDKLAAYESDPGGAWTGRALLAADDADTAGDFPAASDLLAAGLPAGLSLTRVYVPPASDATQMQASRAQLQGALRQGQSLMNYVGHGGLDRLASEGLLVTSDVAQLGNAPHLPVLTALTCLISQFAYPTVSSLGEDLVMQPDGGVIALYGPTWLSYNAPASKLGLSLLPQLSASGGGRLGDRLLRGLNAYATTTGSDRRMLRLYTLLGDPALNLKR